MPQTAAVFLTTFEAAADNNAILDWCISTEVHQKQWKCSGILRAHPHLYMLIYKINSTYQTAAQDFSATSEGETGLRGIKFKMQRLVKKQTK